MKKILLTVSFIVLFAGTSFAEVPFAFYWDVDDYTAQFVSTFEIYQKMPNEQFELVATSNDPKQRSMVLFNIEVVGDDSYFYIVTSYLDGSTTTSKPYHFIKYQPTKLIRVDWDNPTYFDQGFIPTEKILNKERR